MSYASDEEHELSDVTLDRDDDETASLQDSPKGKKDKKKDKKDKKKKEKKEKPKKKKKKKKAGDEDEDEGCCSEAWCLRSCGYWTGFKCCCCQEEEEKPLEPCVQEERFSTDVPCCLLLITCLVIQMIVFLVAVVDKEADPRFLIYKSDWTGRLCGPSSVGGENGSLAAWPDIRYPDVVVCVYDCNDTVRDKRMVTPDFGTNLDELNGTGLQVAGYRTVEYFNAYCIPDPDGWDDFIDVPLEREFDAFIDTLDSFSNGVSVSISDMITAKNFFVLCIVTGLILSLVYTFLLDKFGQQLVWFSMIVGSMSFFLTSFYVIRKGNEARDMGYEDTADIMLAAGVIVAVLGALIIISICVRWHRIALAIHMIKETARALQDVWHMFFYPAVPFVAFLIYLTYWCISGVFMASVVEKHIEDFADGVGADTPYYPTGPTLQSALEDSGYLVEQYVTYKIVDRWQVAVLFHFLLLLWVIEFIAYHTYMVICGVYADWYFANWRNSKQLEKRRGNKKGELSPTPVVESWWRVTRYHLGSVAFASLVIFVVDFLERILTYCQLKFTSEEPSPAQQCVLGCFECIIRALRFFFDRINTTGFVISSVYGFPYCDASMHGVKLVYRNVIRAAALHMVSGYLDTMAKVAIITFNTGIIIAAMYYTIGDDLGSMFMPVVVCLIISWIISWQCVMLYEAGITTIFVCFLVDEKCVKEMEGSYLHASRRLRRMIADLRPPHRVVTEKAFSFHKKMINEDQLAFLHKQSKSKHKSMRSLRKLDGDVLLQSEAEEDKHELELLAFNATEGGCCGCAEPLDVEDAVEAAGNLLTHPPLNRGFVLCRLVATTYMVAIWFWSVIYYLQDDGNGEYWLIYLSHWILTANTLFMLISSFLTWKIFNAYQEAGEIVSVDELQLRFLWNCARAFFQMGLATSLWVPLVYWITLYECCLPDGELALYIHTHGIATLLILCDYFVSPWQLQSFGWMYPLTLGSVWVFWSICFSWWELENEHGDQYIYKNVDWADDAGETTFYVGGILLSLVLIHGVLAQVKNMIIRRWFEKNASKREIKRVQENTKRMEAGLDDEDDMLP